MLPYLSILFLIITSIICIKKYTEPCYHDKCEVIELNRCLVGIGFSLSVAAWGLKRKSLALSGALGGLFVGFTLTYSSYCFLACLFTFFYTSSKATHLYANKKKKFEADYKEGGQRNWIQVLCNGGTATQIALIYLLQGGAGEIPFDFHFNPVRSWLAAAVLCSLAGANGDTWASSLSVTTTPRLITTFQKVPIGTNGGVTTAGVVYSALGGAAVGLSYLLALFFTVELQFSILEQALISICLGTVAGLFGSLFDSMLGATLQYSGVDAKTGKIVEEPLPGVKHISGIPVLNNHSVNMLTTVVTAIVVPSVAAELCSYFR